MKLFYAILISSMLLLSVRLVSAHEHNFDETKQLIDSKISCDKLTDEQLEAMGDYYMEQMHPGETHEQMDQMMGGEGSESLKQVHIQMARRFYCYEDVGGMMGGSMMGSGMMNNYRSYYGYNGFWNLFSLFFLMAAVFFIIWFIYKYQKNKPINKDEDSERYASGEITKKQFEDMKRELNK